MVGLAISITTLVVAIFQGAFLLMLASAAATAIIAFGSHYVTRYAELKEMESQLSDLRDIRRDLESTKTSLTSEVGALRDENGELKLVRSGLTDENARLSRSNEELSAAIMSLQEKANSLETSAKKFESLATDWERQFIDLRDTDKNLAARNAELKNLTETLTSLMAELRRNEAHNRELTIENSKIQGSLQSETAHLEDVRKQLATITNRLEAASAVIIRHISSQPELQEALDQIDLVQKVVVVQ